jgi:hypothetical protein
VWIAGFVAAAWVVVLSASRGAWLGAVASLLAVLAIRKANCRLSPWWLPVGLLGVLGAAALAFPGGQARIAGATPFAATTITGRLLLWSDTASLVADRPAFGVGPSAFVDAVGRFHTPPWAAIIGPYAPPDSPHNVFLQVLAATGVVGTLAVSAFAVVVGRLLWRARPWDAWQAGAVTVAIGMAVSYQFTFTDPATVSLLLLVLGGAIATATATAEPSRSPRAVTTVLFAAWLAAAVFLAGSALVAEARLSAALTSATPDAREIVSAAGTRPWDADLAVRAGRAMNQLAEEGVLAAAPAVDLLARTCPVMPGSTECLQALGDAQTLAGDPQAAQVTLERALESDPVNVDTMLKLGIAAAEVGSTEAAEGWFRRASDLRPSAPEPWQDLAALYRRLGRDADAAEAEATAEHLTPR